LPSAQASLGALVDRSRRRFDPSRFANVQGWTGNDSADDPDWNLTGDFDPPAWRQYPIEAIYVRHPATYDREIADREQGEIPESDGNVKNGEVRPARQLGLVSGDQVFAADRSSCEVFFDLSVQETTFP
jgi:hypothetical protein